MSDHRAIDRDRDRLATAPSPPPSADPGSDHERILREIRESRPKLGCFGKTLTGAWALLAMLGLIALAGFLLRRREQ